MATLDTKYACLYAQQSAEAVLGTNHPALKTLETLAFISALNSGTNTNGFEQLRTFDSNGKERLVSGGNRLLDVRYRPKQCNAVSAGEADPCLEGTPQADLYDVDSVFVEEYNSISSTFDRELYRTLCESPQDAIGITLVEMALSLLKAENTALITKFFADVGDYFDGDDSAVGSGTEKTIKLFNDTAQPNAMGLFKLVQEYKRKGYGATLPIVVGSTSFDAWAFSGPVYAGNDEGLDGRRLPFNLPLFVDYEIDTVAADGLEHILTMVPGHQQHVKWWKYPQGSPYNIVKDNGIKTTINIMGHVWDYTTYDDFCSDNIVVTLGRGFDLWCPPDALFNTDCGGQKGKLNWLTDCGALDCTDIKC